jgi:hypothetical protein
MRILALLVASTLFSQAPEIPEVEGKTLPSVPGPLTDRYPDPSRGLQPRDLETRIRHQARHSMSIPAVALPKGSIAVKDRIADPAGWRAYRVDVPPKGVLHARLTGAHEAWFLVRTVNKWGQLEAGMLQNRIPTGNPEASYKNPKNEVSTVFFVVDTTELGTQGEEFRITFTAK